MDIRNYWRDIARQDAKALKGYFNAGAYINWHCTNEHFMADEFIVATCEYPGTWDAEVERVEERDDLLVTVTRVYSASNKVSFHAISLIRINYDKIVSVDEYWAEDGVAPQWRLDKKIGKPIR